MSTIIFCSLPQKFLIVSVHVSKIIIITTVSLLTYLKLTEQMKQKYRGGAKER